MKFVHKFSYLLLFIILSFATKSLSFDVEEVADGIYVHFGIQQDANKLNAGDIANIGFIIGTKSIMVIDTGGTPKIGEKLFEKIKNISNKPISHVVITHGHPDHYFGTNIFIKKSVLLVGHRNLQRSLDTNFEFYKSLQFMNTKDKSIKQFNHFQITKKIDVNQSLVIDLGDRKVEIEAWPSGHTDNDLSIFDFQTKTFWSENLFIDRVPPIRASERMEKKSKKTIGRDIDLIIPGHGPVKKRDEAIEPMISYFDRLITTIRRAHTKNLSLSEVIKNFPNENKENWLLYNIYHPSNVTKVYTELE